MDININLPMPEILFDLKRISELVSSDCKDAIETGDYTLVEEKGKKFFAELEYIENALNVFTEAKNSSIYYLGQITALLVLASEVNKKGKQMIECKHITSRNPLLYKCVKYLSEAKLATGPEMARDLKLKHRSDLSNMLRRQEKYGLINTYKSGRYNVHMLSAKGKKFLSEVDNNNIRDNMFNTMLKVLDVLNSSLENGVFNEFELILEFCKAYRNMEELITQRSFTSRLSMMKRNITKLIAREIVSYLPENSNAHFNSYFSSKYFQFGNPSGKYSAMLVEHTK